MSLHITNPLIINAIQCARNVVFIHKFSKKSPYRGRGKTTLPPLGHFAPLLWPPLTNPGFTTVTGIAKMHKGRGVDPGGRRAVAPPPQ